MTQTLFDQIENLKKTASQKSDSIIEPRVFSVSEFYSYINELLGFEEVVVEGELSKVDIFKGYLIYFSINDDQSVLPCLIYKNKLDMAGIPLEALEVGSRIKVTGVANVYAKRGDFKLVGERITLAGEGALKKAFELLKKRLEKEGLFRPEAKRPIAPYPQAIGLITSRGAAAYTDFLKVLRARWGGVKIYFYHSSVQGETAVEELLEAFSYFNTAISHLDAIVLTRGGGSLEDLAAFNAEPVVRAVRASKWPVISAVGHERDESLADFAADLRASTPSNAAELLVPTREEECGYLSSLQKKLLLYMEHAIAGEKQYFDRVLGAMDYFFQRPKTELISREEQLHRAAASWLSRIKHDFLQKERLLKSFDPHAVLQRGYSITMSKDGHVIKSATSLLPNELIKTSLREGSFTSLVKEISSSK